MAKRNNNTNSDNPEINDGNEENTVETAAAEEARAEANEKTPTEGEPTEGEPTGDSYTGGYPKSMEESYDGKKISVETTGDFQLYDTSTRTMIAAEGTTEVPENSQFVQTNLDRGKLKKA